MDVLARSLLVAEKIVNDGKLEQAVQDRYAGWRTDLGERIAGGKLSLAELSDLVLSKGIEPKARSGRQEALENLVNKYV
jgi:xylose isomerase